MFAVLIQCRRPDGAQLAPGQHRLQHVAGVHRSFRSARPHNGVELVDEEDDAPLALADLAEDRLKPLLKLATILGACHQAGQIQGKQFLVFHPFGHVAADDPLRQPFGSLLPSFQVHTYDDIDNLDHSITTEVASVIVEPVQGEGGINVPSREFLQAVRARCLEVGAIMHVDEVQSGWGRSGRWFCSEHFGLEPDLVTLGKALGGGMATQSALIANSRAFHGHRENDPDFRGMEKNPWWLTNTFAGSQLSCAASLASIEVYEHDNILQQAEDKGAWLKAQLTELAMQNPQLVREVRGIGLWIGFELQTPELGTRIADELFMRDVLVAQTINNPSTIRIQPPAIITQEQLETVMNAFADSLKAVASAPVGA